MVLGPKARAGLVFASLVALNSVGLAILMRWPSMVSTLMVTGLGFSTGITVWCVLLCLHRLQRTTALLAAGFGTAVVLGPEPFRIAIGEEPISYLASAVICTGATIGLGLRALRGQAMTRSA